MKSEASWIEYCLNARLYIGKPCLAQMVSLGLARIVVFNGRSCGNGIHYRCGRITPLSIGIVMSARAAISRSCVTMSSV